MTTIFATKSFDASPPHECGWRGFEKEVEQLGEELMKTVLRQFPPIQLEMQVSQNSP
jgi:hypothetical protein